MSATSLSRRALLATAQLTLVLATLAGCAEPAHIPALTVDNPGPYPVTVYVLDDEGARLPIASVPARGQRTVTEVIDYGQRWRFQFVYGDHAHVRETTREDLQRADWRVTVPKAFTDLLRSRGVPSPSWRGDPTADQDGSDTNAPEADQ